MVLEGNIQGRVVKHLVQLDYTIRSVADTASRTSGKDIIAISRENKELWVSVKGYPEKSSNIQARHWFSGALFDLILYHGENPKVQLGIAFPDGFVTYTNLLPRVKWFKEHLAILVFWVAEDGSVREEYGNGIWEICWMFAASASKVDSKHNVVNDS
jgi:hypothetical protein